MTLVISHNGFHGFRLLKCRVNGIGGEERREWYAKVSRKAAQRLNKACCGIASCRCGEGVAEIHDAYNPTDGEGRIYLSERQYLGLINSKGEYFIEMRGNYPQG